MLAILAGIKPEIVVKIILNNTKNIAAFKGKYVVTTVPVIFKINELIGNVSRTVIPTPINPAKKPSIIVSALNILEISFLEAPIALKIPISFILSSTEM